MVYIGIKVVDAEPMTAEVAEKKGYRISGNTGDGYEVTYNDGYKSWCPREVFIENYYPVRDKHQAKSIIDNVKDIIFSNSCNIG